MLRGLGMSRTPTITIYPLRRFILGVAFLADGMAAIRSIKVPWGNSTRYENEQAITRLAGKKNVT